MSSNKYDLERFVIAQEECYSVALEEIKSGHKKSHWIWFIFPQIEGLGFSPMSQKHAIKDAQEATLYMKHPILGPRLIEVSEALLTLDTNNSIEVLGSIDSMKLRSCMTLFGEVCPEYDVFKKVLNKYYDGEKDAFTLRVLNKKVSH